MSINLEENNEKSEEINENINIEITKNYSKQKYLSNNDSNTKKEKKKRNKRTKIEKSKTEKKYYHNDNFEKTFNNFGSKGKLDKRLLKEIIYDKGSCFRLILG